MTAEEALVAAIIGKPVVGNKKIQSTTKLNTTRDEHKKSFKNAAAVRQSTKCGCFNCQRIFDANKVIDFVTERDGQKTALCPYCGIDSVIQDFNVEVTPALLKTMNREWFGD